MYFTVVNIFIFYVVVFMTVNISLLSPYIQDDETQYGAIYDLLIFTVWALTMRYTIHPRRVPWIIILYSLCILALLMFHSLNNWASFHFLIPQQSVSILSDQQVHYLKMFMFWFDNLAFFCIVYLLEHRQRNAPNV